MGSYFHDWINYVEVAFSIVRRIVSQIFRILGQKKFGKMRVKNGVCDCEVVTVLPKKNNWPHSRPMMG